MPPPQITHKTPSIHTPLHHGQPTKHLICMASSTAYTDACAASNPSPQLCNVACEVTPPIITKLNISRTIPMVTNV